MTSMKVAARKRGHFFGWGRGWAQASGDVLDHTDGFVCA